MVDNWLLPDCDSVQTNHSGWDRNLYYGYRMVRVGTARTIISHIWTSSGKSVDFQIHISVSRWSEDRLAR